TSPSAPPLPP
nr:Chain B, Protein ORF3 [Paslahepevirus balayani]